MWRRRRYSHNLSPFSQAHNFVNAIGEYSDYSSLEFNISECYYHPQATPKEQEGIPHHLLSVLKPTDTWDVRQYQSQALPIIEEIASRGKLPVLVGGTMYYLQSLLWKEQLIGADDGAGEDEDEALSPPPVKSTTKKGLIVEV